MSEAFDSFHKLLKSADPDRYLTLSAVPALLRDDLLVLYVFNLEVARAPWASHEPMINEMRLQYLLDGIEKIYAGRAADGSEIMAELAKVIANHNLPRNLFDAMIIGRQFDVYDAPHVNLEAFEQYIFATSNSLMALAAQVLGGDNSAQLRRVGFGVGVANLLRAAPELLARGKNPLLADMAPVITQALQALDFRAAHQIFPAILTGWRARATLQAAKARPKRIEAGLLEESPAWRRFSFERCRLTRRL